MIYYLSFIESHKQVSASWLSLQINNVGSAICQVQAQVGRCLPKSRIGFSYRQLCCVHHQVHWLEEYFRDHGSRYKLQFGQDLSSYVLAQSSRRPTHVTGCPTNVQDEFSMVSIDIRMLNHFGTIDRKVDLTKSQCAAQPLSQGSRKNTTWEAVKTATVARFPRFVPFYFG